MSDLNELFQDDRCFSESFYLCKHYFAEYITVKAYDFSEQKALKLTRLRKKGNTIFLDSKYKVRFIPFEKLEVKYPEGSWLCAVPTGEKEDGRKKEEINFLCCLLEADIAKNMKQLKKILKTKGIIINNEENKNE